MTPVSRLPILSIRHSFISLCVLQKQRMSSSSSLQTVRKRRRCDRDLNVRPARIKDLEKVALRFTTKRIDENVHRIVRLSVMVSSKNNGSQNHQRIHNKVRKIKVPDAEYWIHFPPHRIVGHNQLYPTKNTGELHLVSRRRCISVGERTNPHDELYWGKRSLLRFAYNDQPNLPEMHCTLPCDFSDCPCREIVVSIHFEREWFTTEVCTVLTNETTLSNDLIRICLSFLSSPFDK
jgi:hypothetical protein